MTKSDKIVYADCFSGVSGDMFLGALLHLGVPLEMLRSQLSLLKLRDWDITAEPTLISGIGCIKVNVKDSQNQQLRHLSAIKEILLNSDLEKAVASLSIEVFEEIARAEAKVHDIDIERVHFHEVGAIDTIIDIVGVISGLHYLGIGKISCAPVPVPRGFVKCAHGTLPLPAPAVCEILQGIPCYGVELQQELVTPTGAALLKVLASDFGPMPAMKISASGYGAGSHALANGQPNLFRLLLGSSEIVTEKQQVEIIETNLDDWSAEGFPYLCDRLFAQGALDVSLAPIQMKKGRPGYSLQVICGPQIALEIRNIIFSETTSIGIRYRKEFRHTLSREILVLETPWGPMKAKSAATPGGERVYPEYEECRRIAEKFDIPLMQVYDFVRKKGAVK